MAPACTRVHVVAGAPQSGWCQCLCPQGKALQDQQLGLTQAPFKLLFLPSSGAYEMLCASFQSEVSIFHSPLQLPKSKPCCWPSESNVLGAHIPLVGPPGWGAQCRAQTPSSLGEYLQL